MLSSQPWFTAYRPFQESTIHHIIEAFDSGHQAVFLNGPTGSGKTIVAAGVHEKLGGKALYTCTTKPLQHQVADDFDYGHVIMGRDNYPTEHNADAYPHINCGLCTKQKRDDECRWCETRCPYEQARSAATSSTLAIANTAYALNAWRSERSWLHGRDLAIIDECDTFESELCRHIEVNLSQAWQSKLRVYPPKKGSHLPTWQRWLTRIQSQLRDYRVEGDGPDAMRERKRRKDLIDQLSRLELDDENWIRANDNPPTFKPVRVDRFADRWLPHAQRFLLMSGTIINAEQMADDLGIEDWAYVEMPSTFPAARRPVIIDPVADMSYKSLQDDPTTIPRMAQGILKILEAWPGQRVLIHTVSYTLNNNLYAALQNLGGKGLTGRELITYTSHHERADALTRYRNTHAAVLLAASFDRGVDLPDDNCRVNIVCKMPHAALGDRQVSARMHAPGGDSWYTTQTARTLVQMLGRAVRHEQDWAANYILDSGFVGWWRKAKHLIPRYIDDAIDWTRGREGLQKLREEVGTAT